MKLTAKQAVEKTLAVWQHRAETGMNDDKDCYLCVYTEHDSTCDRCPWYQKYGDCDLNKNYDLWWDYVYLDKNKRRARYHARRLVTKLEKLLEEL